MKNILLENAPLAAVTALVGALPTTVMAHAEVEHASTSMVWLHALAHTLGDHPITLIVMIAALAGAYGLHRRSERKAQAVRVAPCVE